MLDFLPAYLLRYAFVEAADGFEYAGAVSMHWLLRLVLLLVFCSVAVGHIWPDASTFPYNYRHPTVIWPQGVFLLRRTASEKLCRKFGYGVDSTMGVCEKRPTPPSWQEEVNRLLVV